MWLSIAAIYRGRWMNCIGRRKLIMKRLTRISLVFQNVHKIVISAARASMHASAISLDQKLQPFTFGDIGAVEFGKAVIMKISIRNDQIRLKLLFTLTCSNILPPFVHRSIVLGATIGNNRESTTSKQAVPGGINTQQNSINSI